MLDYLAVKDNFDSNNLSYFTSYPKSMKPMKSVIRQLPQNPPAEDISD